MLRAVAWIELVSGNRLQKAQLPHVCLPPIIHGSFLFCDNGVLRCERFYYLSDNNLFNCSIQRRQGAVIINDSR